jgi:xanthine dehydrogenase accessory factor
VTDSVFGPIRTAIRGGGDLGSGVAYRLIRCGFPVLITEMPHPLLLRRAVSFGSAVIEGEITVEGIIARRVANLAEAVKVQSAGEIPVLVDPEGDCFAEYDPVVLVDAVETNRGHHLGRVIREGGTQPDTGQPGGVMGHGQDRVLRAPADGPVMGIAAIGSIVQEGQPIALVDGQYVVAPFEGVLRGLIYDGIEVKKGLKIADVDPRADPRHSFTISEKALAVGGGVVEALLSSAAIRERLK